MNRLKILVCAYACSPYKGSEPGVGWGFVQALARRHDLWVIVEEEKFRGDVERYAAANPAFGQSVRFHFIAKRRNRLLRRLWPPSYYWYYRRWHRDALELARELNAEIGFDLAHQLTMVGFREPGYLWKLGVPFVWGPIGGMGLFPWRFLDRIGLRGALHYLGYNLYNAAQMRWMRRPAEAARKAGIGLIAATRENLEGAARHWGVEGTLLSEVGLPRPPVQQVPARAPEEPLRVVWSGLHLPRKALHLGLHAMARLPKQAAWTLDVLGAGPMTRQWQALARRLGIDGRVRFNGWLAREQALALMAGSHAMLITSLRDLTSTVTVEALALGLPVVCPDHCGFADAVDDDCGVRVPVDSPRRTIDGIARAVARLAADEPYRQRLAQGALKRAADFDWDAKADVVDTIYRRVLAT